MDADDTLSERVADAIRARLAYRRRRGTTPSSGKELAAIIGLSQSGMSSRLTGATPIDLNDLAKIAAALDVEIGELLPAPARRGTEGTGGSRVVDQGLTVGPRSIHHLGHVVRQPADPHPAEQATHRAAEPAHTGQRPPVQRADRDRPHRPSWTHAR